MNMNKIIVVVALSMTSAAYAADFQDLAVSAPAIKAAADAVQVSATPDKVRHSDQPDWEETGVGSHPGGGSVDQNTDDGWHDDNQGGNTGGYDDTQNGGGTPWFQDGAGGGQSEYYFSKNLNDIQQARQVRKAFDSVVEHGPRLLDPKTNMFVKEHCRKEVLENLTWLNTTELRLLNMVVDRMQREGSLSQVKMTLKELARQGYFPRVQSQARELVRKVRRLSDNIPWY